MNEIGCFGKVPAHGDFVWQSLPARFVTPWDNWLQAQMLQLKEQRPEDWLQGYLCSPIWRFLIQDDALGAATWCGIITPSVDVVGRYFPFTIATALPRDISIVMASSALSPWLHQLEEAALAALTASLSIEEVLARSRALDMANIPGQEREEQEQEQQPWSGVVSSGESWSDQLLGQILRTSFEQPCHWSTIDANSGATRYRVTEGFTGFSELFAS